MWSPSPRSNRRTHAAYPSRATVIIEGIRSSDQSRWRLLSLPVAGWVLFDFADTIFSYAVLTRFFNEWVVIERGRPDWWVGAMGFVVSALLLVALPFLGHVADRSGRRKPLLVGFALVCVTATALIGLSDNVGVALLAAGVAIFAYNAAEAQYHPLLASVAPPERRSRVSGIGVGVGYVGGLIAIFVLGRLAADDAQRAFLPAAGLVLLFALPCFLWVRDLDPGARVGAPPLARVPRAAAAQLVATLRAARGRPHGRFLLARFFYVDALATVIAFVAVYARRVADFSSGQIDALIALAAFAGIFGAMIAGLAAERLGPKRVLSTVLVLTATTLLAAGISGSGALLWVLAPVVGVSLGSVWASDRVLLLRLVGPEQRGEVFGLYTLVGKVSSGVGPLVLWGGTIFVLYELLALAGPAAASRVALCVLAVSALAGLGLLWPLSDREPATREDARAVSAG